MIGNRKTALETNDPLNVKMIILRTICNPDPTHDWPSSLLAAYIVRLAFRSRQVSSR